MPVIEIWSIGVLTKDTLIPPQLIEKISADTRNDAVMKYIDSIESEVEGHHTWSVGSKDMFMLDGRLYWTSREKAMEHFTTLAKDAIGTIFEIAYCRDPSAPFRLIYKEQ